MNAIKKDILFKTFSLFADTQHRHLHGVFVTPGATFVFCTCACEFGVPTKRRRFSLNKAKC